MLKLTSTRSQLFLLVFLICFLSIMILVSGSFELSFYEIYSALSGSFSGKELTTAQNIILNIRLPKMISALISGGSLAVCGLLMQVYFKNPLAGPFVLGIHSGASLFVAIFLMASHIIPDIFLDYGVVFFSIIGSFLVLLLLLYVGHKVKGSVILLIIGLLISHLASGMTNVLVVTSPAKNIKNYLLWSQGSFSRLNLEDIPIMISIVVCSLVIIFCLAKVLNILLMNEDYAISMGVCVKKVKWKLIALTGILSGTITAFCGPISFVGILGPHIARMFFKTNNHKVLLPSSFLIGSFLTLLVSYIVEVNDIIVLPINSVFGIIGVPFIVYLILKRGEHV